LRLVACRGPRKDHTRLIVKLCVLSLLLPPVAAQQPPHQHPELNSQVALSLAARRAKLQSAIEEDWQYQLRNHPEFATAIGDYRYNDRLDDRSASAAEKEAQHERHEIQQFSEIDTTGFPEQEALNKVLMLRQLRDRVESAQYRPWEMSVNQMSGVHLDLATLATQMPFETEKDYENYLARLHAVPLAFEQVKSNLQQGLRDRLVPPKYLLEKVASQAADIATKPLPESPFTKPLEKFSSAIPAPDRQRLTQAIETVVRNDVQPAYSKFAAFVRDQYAPHGRTDYGVWALPDGAPRYRFAVRHMTTTDLTPDQIYTLGLKQVADIEEQMVKVGQSLGFQDLRSFNEHIRKDPDLYGKSSQQIFDLYRHYTDQMYAKLPQFFGHVPKTQLEVVPMEAHRAPDAVPADYTPGAGDGSRPGRVNVNEYDPTHRLLLNVEAIAYHEGIPGHHLQFSIAQELPDLPAFRRFAEYNAYSEGWAFYAEQIGKQAGFYQDPYSEYGRLENEMWRSVRLVVDTGVHAKHWSRQQMIDFFREHTAMDDQNIETEVDRYIAWPGQALAYRLGQMKIVELRDQAKQALGPRFDIRAFHDAVLNEGPVPLDILEARIKAWVAQQEGK
jgi:uncharacterized protein (DUF885 family)